MFYCWDSEGQDKDVCVYMKVLYFGSFLTCFEHVFFYCECSVFGHFYCGLCVASAKACKNVSLTDASSYLPRAVVGFELRGRCMRDPPEAYAPCPLALHYDGDQNCEREVIANGRRGQGSCLSQNGFSTAVHRSLHEHVTNNHSDIEWRYEVIL